MQSQFHAQVAALTTLFAVSLPLGCSSAGAGGSAAASAGSGNGGAESAAGSSANSAGNGGSSARGGSAGVGGAASAGHAGTSGAGNAGSGGDDGFIPPAPSPQYPVNRAPLQPTAFLTLPIGSVAASGWLLKQLQLQAAGLSGHAEELYSENGPTNQWLGGNGDNWERGPYYVRANVALAYVLNDSALIAKMQKWIDWAVKSQTADGNFGPASLDADDWWPRMLMLQAIEDVYDATSDAKLLTFLQKYFQYQASHPTHGSDGWATARMQEDGQAAIYMYNRSPDFSASQFTSLLSAVRGATEDWIGYFNSKSLGDTHNVNVAMAWKAPAVFWQGSGVASDRASYATGLDFVLKQNSQPEGLPSGDESLRGPGSTEGFETCGVVDSIASHAYAMRVFGAASTGDLLENIAFNALSAATNRTMTGIDYYSLPNEPEAIHGTSKFPQDYANGMTMSWQSGFPCCRFNWHLGWPRFTQSTWAATLDGGLAALTYAPTVVSAKVAGGQTVTFAESTNYPFAEQIQFVFHGAESGFPLTVRIPQWATQATLTVNGAAEAQPLTPGSLYVLQHRIWREGDTVVLALPMPLSTTEQINGSVSVRRGPLVYALQIGENWKETQANQVAGIDFGEFEITPSTPWNYALAVDPANPAASLKVVTRAMPENPFIQATTPVILQGTGRVVPGWGLRTDAVLAQEVPKSPVRAPGPDVPLTLVPFGAETLRISEFPVLASGQAALRKPAPASRAETMLVELYAPWCAACAKVSGNVAAAAERLAKRAQVVRVNVDEIPDAAARWNIDALPAFLVLQGDHALAKHVGAASADELVALVQHAGN